GDVVRRRGLPDGRRRRAGPLGHVVSSHCYLQQVPHEHPQVLLRDDTDELALAGDLLHASHSAAPALLRAKANRRADCHLLWVSQWNLHWPPQPLPWLQLSGLLPDDQAGYYTVHHALGDHLSEQEVQPEHQGLSHGPPPGSWHRIGHRSPAQSPRLHHRSAHHRCDLCLPDPDQPNPEEAQGVFHSATVPVLPVPIRGAAHHRPLRRQAPDKEGRLRVRVHIRSRGVHPDVVRDRGVRQLQHLPGDRHDVASDVPGVGPPQDVPHPLLRLRPPQRPLHAPQPRRHPHRHLRHGPLLLLLRLREQEEDRGRNVARQHPGFNRRVPLQMSEKDSAPLLGTKTSPWQESNGVENFDDVPRTAKSAFSRQL
uniref:Uncharacterized protein n=1 Tax=Aegilops tauschii subsp. strangulata TaxID=200361 RepID=A0A452YG03_AEGTS